MQLNEQTALMYIHTGGFGWVTADRPTAKAGTTECLISLQVDSESEIDELVGLVDAAGGQVVSGPEQKS